jgi:hypothetical protein
MWNLKQRNLQVGDLLINSHSEAGLTIPGQKIVSVQSRRARNVYRWHPGLIAVGKTGFQLE